MTGTGILGGYIWWVNSLHSRLSARAGLFPSFHLRRISRAYFQLHGSPTLSSGDILFLFCHYIHGHQSIISPISAESLISILCNYITCTCPWQSVLWNTHQLFSREIFDANIETKLTTKSLNLSSVQRPVQSLQWVAYGPGNLRFPPAEGSGAGCASGGVSLAQAIIKLWIQFWTNFSLTDLYIILRESRCYCWYCCGSVFIKSCLPFFTVLSKTISKSSLRQKENSINFWVVLSSTKKSNSRL